MFRGRTPRRQGAGHLLGRWQVAAHLSNQNRRDRQPRVAGRGAGEQARAQADENYDSISALSALPHTVKRRQAPARASGLCGSGLCASGLCGGLEGSRREHAAKPPEVAHASHAAHASQHSSQASFPKPNYARLDLLRPYNWGRRDGRALSKRRFAFSCGHVAASFRPPLRLICREFLPVHGRKRRAARASRGVSQSTRHPLCHTLSCAWIPSLYFPACPVCTLPLSFSDALSPTHTLPASYTVRTVLSASLPKAHSLRLSLSQVLSHSNRHTYTHTHTHTHNKEIPGNEGAHAWSGGEKEDWEARGRHQAASQALARR